MPFDLKITALADVIEGLAYLHSRGIIHGDVKPLNVLVCGEEANEFIFKVANYGCPVNNNSMQTSCSTTMKQLMTPAPELFPCILPNWYVSETIQGFRHLFVCHIGL